MSRRNRPNLFIVGAPRSGTTSLHNYLGQHPEVFMSPFKEPHYFASDFRCPAYPTTEAEYLALFADARNETHIGEASTAYLYSKMAALNIRDFEPEARIIMILRNPVDMIYSLHARRCWEGAENVDNFERALACEHDRAHGRRLPPGMALPREYLLYTKMGEYACQVRRYLQVFPKESVLIIIYDDFDRDAAGTFARVCEFLEIDPSFRCSLEVLNRNKRNRSRWLAEFVRNPPGWTTTLVPAFVRRAVNACIWRINVVELPRPPMSPGLRQRLTGQFAQGIAELASLIGRDLTHWRG